MIRLKNAPCRYIKLYTKNAKVLTSTIEFTRLRRGLYPPPSTPFSVFAQFSPHSARSLGGLAAIAAKRSPLGWAASVISGVSMVVFLSSEGLVVG